MALPNVSINYKNGGLGLVAPSDDRVVGLIVNGVAGFVMPETAIQVFSNQMFLDSTVGKNSGSYGDEMRRQVADFYSVAGDGAELWVMVSLSSDSLSTILDTKAKVLLDGANGRINVLGISRFQDPADSAGVPITVTNGLASDTIDALDNAQALATNYTSRKMPLRIILDGRNFDGVVADLPDLKSKTFNRVGVCLGSNLSAAKNAAIGLLLGRVASNPVNRNIGRVKDGIASSDGFLTGGINVQAFGLSSIALNDKGYIFLRTFVGKSGCYWNDDHMATSDTDDFYSLANGRVIDKAARIAYATFLNEILDTVQVDGDTGKIVKTTLKQYESLIERAVGLSMAATGEISAVDAFVDPNQDILATSTLTVELRITPTGTNRVIVVNLGLNNPNVTA